MKSGLQIVAGAFIVFIISVGAATVGLDTAHLFSRVVSREAPEGSTWHVTCLLGDTMIDERTAKITWDGEGRALSFSATKDNKPSVEYVIVNSACIWRRFEP